MVSNFSSDESILSRMVDWKKPRIAVVGAGAIGGYYGAMLAHAGFDVHFLLRSDYDIVREKGWQIHSYLGDFNVRANRIRVYNDPAKMPVADLVIVALKTTENHHLQGLLTPLVGPETVLLTLQNGLGNEEQLAEHFGAERVLGGIAFMCSNREAPGVINHISHGLITLGEFAGKPGDRLAAIAHLMSSSGISVKPLANLRHGRWEKLVWNIPFNGLGAALDCATDRILASPSGMKMVRTIMHEVLDAAGSIGLKYPADIIDAKISSTREMGSYRTSMQIDRQHNRALEIETIFRRPLQIGCDQGIGMPVSNMVCEQLVILDAGR